MDRQTLRDWVYRFNDQAPDGLGDIHAGGLEAMLSPEKLSELAAIVEAGLDRENDGVVRWRRVDLQRVVRERFGVGCCERYIGTFLKKLGFSHISARPRYPAHNGEIVDLPKKIPNRAGTLQCLAESPDHVCVRIRVGELESIQSHEG